MQPDFTDYLKMPNTDLQGNYLNMTNTNYGNNILIKFYNGGIRILLNL